MLALDCCSSSTTFGKNEFKRHVHWAEILAYIEGFFILFLLEISIAQFNYCLSFWFSFPAFMFCFVSTWKLFDEVRPTNSCQNNAFYFSQHSSRFWFSDCVSMFWNEHCAILVSTHGELENCQLTAFPWKVLKIEFELRDLSMVVSYKRNNAETPYLR